MKTITIDGIEYEITPVARHEKPSGKRWRAEKYGQYFSMAPNGEIVDYYDDYERVDNYLYNTGNYYKTAEEAARARDKQLALVRVTDKLREIEADVGWVINWDYIDQEKHVVSYSRKFNKFDSIFTLRDEQPWFGIYSCRSAINHVIEHMQDDLKLIFGVE